MTEKKSPKNKIKFTMTMDMKGNISSTSTKAANKFVSPEECEQFVKETKERLDDLLYHWKQLYTES